MLAARGGARRRAPGVATSRSCSTTARRSPTSTTACAACSPSVPISSRATWRCCSSPPGSGSRPAARARSTRGSPSDGARAHSARPWMGVNAVHRAAPLLARIAAHEAPTVTVDGLDYRESLQVVRVEAGIANNVVPDRCEIVVNRRYAPACSFDEALAQTKALFDDADEVEIVSASPAAAPNLTHPLDQRAGRGRRPRGAAEARLDRCRALHRARHSGSQLRPGRSRACAHGGRTRRTRRSRTLPARAVEVRGRRSDGPRAQIRRSSMTTLP